MPSLFGGDQQALPPAVEALLRRTNPWWAGQPLPELPPYRRWAFKTALQRLKNGLAPATVIRGPRQVGKTTIQQQIIEHLLQEEKVAPQRILQVQFDDMLSLKEQTPKVQLLKDKEDPLLAICRWFEDQILQKTFNTVARAGEPAYIFFDEVQNLAAWAPQLKSLVDHNTVRVLVTGSSALRLEMGRDSLAGRISTLNLGRCSCARSPSCVFRKSLTPACRRTASGRCCGRSSGAT